jgi:hypothetical protein
MMLKVSQVGSDGILIPVPPAVAAGVVKTVDQLTHSLSFKEAIAREIGHEAAGPACKQCSASLQGALDKLSPQPTTHAQMANRSGGSYRTTLHFGIPDAPAPSANMQVAGLEKGTQVPPPTQKSPMHFSA